MLYMSSNIFTLLFNHEVLASLCSCFECFKVSWITELEDSVTWFQYLAILVRIKGTWSSIDLILYCPIYLLFLKKKDLDRLNALLEGKKMQKKHQDNLQKRHKLKKKKKLKVKEEILQRIKIKKAKINRYQ